MTLRATLRFCDRIVQMIILLYLFRVLHRGKLLGEEFPMIYCTYLKVIKLSACNSRTYVEFSLYLQSYSKLF